MKRKLLLWVWAMLIAVPACWAQVTVHLTVDEGARTATTSRMEANLSKVLSEVNKAYKANRELNIVGLPLDEFAKNSLLMLWANVHFYCDDADVVDRCWNFSDSYMVRQIPLILCPPEKPKGQFQNAVVEFDKQGLITDFRFSMDAVVGESFENGGRGVADQERIAQILTWCERLRTAYNTKDIGFLENIYSDNALIITGTVVTRGEVPKVVYTKQDKRAYIAKLKNTFSKNEWINIKFSQIGTDKTGGVPPVTRSSENPNMYGVRLLQEWNTTHYSDVGYLFLLWDFSKENAPEIQVRTWQPEKVGNKALPEEDIYSLSDFNL